jgi:hypothetical protein
VKLNVLYEIFEGYKSGSFYHQAKIVRKPEFLPFCDFFMTYLRKMYLQKAVFRIRIHMFLGLPDPDPFVRDMDPDPSVIMQK